MSKDIVYFAENVYGLDLTEKQKELLIAVQNSKDRGQKIFLSCGRTQGIGLLKNILYSFETWLKDQRIAELEEQLKKFTEPKKVKFNKFNGYRGTRFRCPNCNKQIENCIDYTADYYCKHCGQSIIYPKFRVVNNVGELYFEEAQAKLRELKG